ncbi:hypothetical protein TIFTF001_000611 [Ficus carica]|uniref:Uncharacterized protein n=1 Tax=Ficus carica TaxID=3494 RepID=A0AA87YVL0_FICCA|nr:hypothetical protein TIFTF001_000611 [Ficus carica]
MQTQNPKNLPPNSNPKNPPLNSNRAFDKGTWLPVRDQPQPQPSKDQHWLGRVEERGRDKLAELDLVDGDEVKVRDVEEEEAVGGEGGEESNAFAMGRRRRERKEPWRRSLDRRRSWVCCSSSLSSEGVSEGNGVVVLVAVGEREREREAGVEERDA